MTDEIDAENEVDAAIEIRKAITVGDQSAVDKFKFNNDIGNFIGKTLDDYTKFNLLKNPWNTPDNFNFFFRQRRKNF